MQKYDLNEFLYPYNKVKGDYKYLNAVNDEEGLSALFDLTVTFLNSCQRPQHIEAEFTRNIHAFGREGYFPADV